ncbi:MAG: glycosyltransferase [Clostridia bacterium]|nr:glycosyltransferase [Clostridia bacterium]
MIKILFFIETLTGGGAEKVLRDLVNHMDRTKFDITVQTVWPCDAAKYLDPGIRYKSMYTFDNKVNRLRCRIEAESRLAYRLHIKDDYDIECAYLEMGPTKIMASSTNRKAKKLAWVHCDLTKAVADPKAYAEKSAPWYERFDRVVCVSQNVKEQFDELFRNRYDSTVVYNVIDDDAIRDKANRPMPENIEKRRLTVLSLGRFTRQKNYMRLLRAHKQLLDKGIEHDLWILGEGPERPKLERFIEENGLGDSVWMPGFMENPYPFMREADLLACSSIYEGFSTFITEGVVLGKPIVTTDVTGMREILGDSEYGLIVKDDEEFCKGMERMLTDAELRAYYSNAASLRSRDFSAQALTRTTERFFEELTCN